ncbi:MAG: amidohydrolase [Lachnospiraceae bacterium]|jgi:5-methylthioadenosine/S-adenosylhomocysteine deaminase|nr:amidohydrolase [Lachnospiraceae bacterium]
MNYRLYNARILTMEENRPIFNGEVHVRGERIVYVGETGVDADIASADTASADTAYGDVTGADTAYGEVTGFDTVYGDVNSAHADKAGIARAGEARSRAVVWDREIDCHGNLLLPGFKNAHTHSAMTLMRSHADDQPLSQWLNQQIFPVEAQMTGEDIYHLTRLAILEYLSGGITAIFEMYLTPETIAAACRDSGMRCVQVGGINDFSAITPARMAELYEQLNGRDRLNRFHLGFHAEYTCQEGLLREVAGLSQHYKAPVFTHLAETAAEVCGCRERHQNQTPAVYLESLGLFDHGGGGYHCVHMTDEDLDLFQQKGLYAVTNPASNLKLASGIAPIAAFLKKGIPVAIGTDGPASNNCLDFFREMFLVTGLAKYREADASAVAAAKVLQMACVNGARCMGLTESVNLSAGQLADIILLDLQQPNMQPINNPVANIVYSGTKQNVIMTMINGRILYDRDGFHIGEDPTVIYAKANEIAARLLR